MSEQLFDFMKTSQAERMVRAAVAAGEIAGKVALEEARDYCKLAFIQGHDDVAVMLGEMIDEFAADQCLHRPGWHPTESENGQLVRKLSSSPHWVHGVIEDGIKLSSVATLRAAARRNFFGGARGTAAASGGASTAGDFWRFLPRRKAPAPAPASSAAGGIDDWLSAGGPKSPPAAPAPAAAPPRPRDPAPPAAPPAQPAAAPAAAPPAAPAPAAAAAPAAAPAAPAPEPGWARSLGIGPSTSGGVDDWLAAGAPGARRAGTPAPSTLGVTPGSAAPAAGPTGSQGWASDMKARWNSGAGALNEWAKANPWGAAAGLAAAGGAAGFGAGAVLT